MTRRTEICPTSALYRRADGIVDFDNRRCIGCKACMQACPYDALYIDPNNNTAVGGNFCAHRVEMSLRTGMRDRLSDAGYSRRRSVDNPDSKVSRVVATQKVSVQQAAKGIRSLSCFMWASKAICSSQPGFRGRTDGTSLQHWRDRAAQA